MQKNLFEYAISLRATHPSMSALELSSLVGLPPQFSWSVGEQRKNPKGRHLGGTRDESYCTFDVGKGSDGEVARCLRAAVSGLESRKSELLTIGSSGGDLMFLVCWHAEGDEGETFDAPLLRSMSELGVSLSINVLALSHVMEAS